MKKIIVDGSEFEVLDYQWKTEPYKIFNKIICKWETLPFDVDYIKAKISQKNCNGFLQKVLFANLFVIEADGKKAEFYLSVDETKRLFYWLKQNKIEEIEIEFVGTSRLLD